MNLTRREMERDVMMISGVSGSFCVRTLAKKVIRNVSFLIDNDCVLYLKIQIRNMIYYKQLENK